MQQREYPDVPPDFGHWLAGFIDGEGCFQIIRMRNRRGFLYRIYFLLNLRDDDWRILETCAAVTGLGHLKRCRRPRGSAESKRHRSNAKPQAEWIVHTKADCVQLVALLDRFPLRAKKARDYDIWRKAVLAHSRLVRARRPRDPADWSAIAPLYEQLRAVRLYEAPELPSPPAARPPPTLWD